MLAAWKETRFKTEIALLLALCFFLPLLEAPKNLAWLGYLAAWLANRIRARDFGGPWDRWDTLFALWIGSGFVVALVTQFTEFRGGDEWKGTMDVVRYVSIGWLVKRAAYGDRVQRWVLGALVASVAIGLVVGHVRLWSGIGKSGFLQLYSVGHVNHSAIYMAILLGVFAAWLFACYRGWSAALRTWGVVLFAFLFVSLLITASRAAFVAGVILLFLLSVGWWRRWRVPLLGVAVASAIAFAAAFALHLDIVAKQERYEAANAKFSLRDGIWRTGLLAWQHYPWFGVGLGNYSEISEKRVQGWLAAEGRTAPPGHYVIWVHGHSLFVNSLTERGIIGVAPLFALLIAWGVGLLRRRPAAADGDLAWMVWGASASALGITVLAGLLNTTLHHEHGILAVLLLGLWLGRAKANPAS